MSVWRRLSDVDLDRAGGGRTVVTVGTFDGVHRGHHAVLARTVQQAWTLGGRRDGRAPVVAVTLDPHPMAVLAPDRAPTMLTRIDRRVQLLQAAGADDVLVLGFDRTVAGWSPEEFVGRVLADGLNAGVVVVGAAFRFGARAAGTVDTLRTEGAEHGFTVDAVEIVGDRDDEPWSSTAARSAIAAGDVVAAARILGRPHSVAGTVVEGEHRGRELGFPTANVAVPGDILLPADGIYAGWFLRADGVALPTAINLGRRPTFYEQAHASLLEAHVLDFDGDLYDEHVKVRFVARLHGEIKYDSVEALVAGITRDCDDARVLLTTETA